MPASWPPLEPAKFLALDGQSIFKFTGFGHYGNTASARALILSHQGFSPHHLDQRCGFGECEFVPGRMLQLCDRSPELLGKIAEYLAFRSMAFPSNIPQTPELEKMLRWNWQLEFGDELSDDESRFCSTRAVVCDGCMMPHKWLRAENGRLLKLDANSHGDNHFFPGPCDIAWDVAGAIVEWEMNDEVREGFVRQYELLSGDKITERLTPYILGYVAFRLGWSKMAALAMQGEFDEALLSRDYQRYRAAAMRLRTQRTPESSTKNIEISRAALLRRSA